MEQTDFMKILEELRVKGVNDYKISEMTGIERSKITKLGIGIKKQAFYDDGMKIMGIY